CARPARGQHSGSPASMACTVTPPTTAPGCNGPVDSPKSPPRPAGAGATFHPTRAGQYLPNRNDLSSVLQQDSCPQNPLDRLLSRRGRLRLDPEHEATLRLAGTK